MLATGSRFEYSLVVLVLLLVFLVYGGGKWSADHRISRKREDIRCNRNGQNHQIKDFYDHHKNETGFYYPRTFSFRDFPVLF